MSETLQLIARLSAMRRTARRRLIGFGTCAVLAGGVVAFFTVVALDWLLELPWLLRVIVAVIFFAGFVGATWHWILNPLRASLTLEEIAGRLELHFPELRDSLSSAVNFTQRDDSFSEPMTRQVIDAAHKAVSSLPLEGTLTIRPMALRAVWLVLAFSALLGAIAVAPQWMRLGLSRYVDPLGDSEWPRSVSITPLTGDLIVAVGDSQTLRMGIARGMSDRLRPLVHMTAFHGESTSLAMGREDGDTFAVTIDSLTRDLRYWFQAGDADTARHPFHIRVVRRPAVLEVHALVQPPPYAPSLPDRTVDFHDGPIRVVAGSTAQVFVRSSKRLTSKENRVSGLRLSNDTFVSFDPYDALRKQARATLRIIEDKVFRLELWDDDGFSNRDDNDFEFKAVADAPPVVAIEEPRAVTEVTPIGVVLVSVRVTDDLGIEKISLLAQTTSDALIPPYELETIDTKIEASGVEIVAKLEWSIAPLGLGPGDAVTAYAQAIDNRHIDDTFAGQSGDSSVLKIRVISVAEFETRLRSDIALVEARLRHLQIDQSGLLERAEQLRGSSAEESLTLAQRVRASQASAEQSHIIRPLQDLARKLSDVAERMKRNGVGNEAGRDQLAALSASLNEMAVGPVSESSEALRRAADQQAMHEQHTALSEATALQERTMNELGDALRSVSDWGGFQSILTRGNDLLQRQESVRTTTQSVGKSLLGLSPDALTPEQRAELKRLSTEQDQLGRDVDEWLARLSRERDTSHTEDAATASVIDEALRAAQAHDLTARLRAASEAVAQNRTAGALMEQKAAAHAMRETIAALRDRDDRVLAELRKVLTGLREQVAVLIEEQTALRDATHEAATLDSSNDVIAGLETEQRRLRINSNALADDVSADRATAEHGPTLREAADRMREAELKLSTRSTESATEAQDRTIAALRKALDDLDEQSREAENEAFRRTLADVREHLEAIRDAQREVNDGIDQVKAYAEEHGQLGRSQAREAVRLSRAQRDVLTQTDEVMPEVEKVVVYRWALVRITKWMEQVETTLYERRVDEEAVDTAHRIVHELEKLIGALVETEALPLDTDFVESESAGSAGGEGSSETVAVPTVAELLVLKTLQVDINDRTRVLSESVVADQATETDLRELRAVGEDQAEVQRLSKLVTQKARQ